METKVKCDKCGNTDILHYIKSKQEEPKYVGMEEFAKSTQSPVMENAVLIINRHVLLCKSCGYTYEYTAS